MSTWAGGLLRIGRRARVHGRVLAFGLALGAVAGVCASAPTERTEGGVAAMLGAAVGGTVGADDFVWEASGGALSDWARGRFVLFLAELPAPEGGPQKDLFRAWVRVSRDGTPLRVRGVKNLTGTPEGDERALVARGRWAAFTTRTQAGIQSVTLLDLGGTAPPGASIWDRWRSGLDAYLETGSPRGIATTVVSLPDGPDEVALDLTEASLVMALGPERVPAALEIGTGVLHTGGHRAFGISVHPTPRAERSSYRIIAREAAELLGPDAAATATELWVDARELGRAPERADDPIATPASGPAASFATGDTFPPPPAPGGEPLEYRPLPSLLELSFGAGPVGPGFAVGEHRGDGGTVHLVAIDTRQLELRIAGGYDTPSPRVAAPGGGRVIEEDPPRTVVGAFVGATPWPGDPPAGAVYDRTVVARPQAGLLTLVVDRRGPSRVGLWPDYPAVPTFVSSLRQEPASESYSHRPMERAGLCAVESGHWLYAWSRYATRADVDAAFDRADCNARFHFGGPLEAAGFGLIENAKETSISTLRVLHPAMSLPGDALVSPFPHELYYLVARRPSPPVPLPIGSRWEVALGDNPPPKWLPAMYQTTVEHLGVKVGLVAIAPERFQWRIGAGEKERKHRMGGSFAVGLPAADVPRMLASIGLANGRSKRTRGLALSGSRGHRFRGSAGLLWASESGLEVLLSDEAPEVLDGDATELPLTADRGEYQPDGRVPGPLAERAALCIGAEGWVLMATARFESHEATTKTLLEAGCQRVVALDRGTHQPPLLRRAGTSEPPAPRYEVTSLFLLAVPERGHVLPLAKPARLIR